MSDVCVSVCVCVLYVRVLYVCDCFHRLCRNLPPATLSCQASNPSVQRLCNCYPPTCPAGYILYPDVDGSEGHASCFAITATATSRSAFTIPSPTHLITTRSSSSFSTLTVFLGPATFYWQTTSYLIGVRARYCMPRLAHHQTD